MNAIQVEEVEMDDQLECLHNQIYAFFVPSFGGVEEVCNGRKGMIRVKVCIY